MIQFNNNHEVTFKREEKRIHEWTSIWDRGNFLGEFNGYGHIFSVDIFIRLPFCGLNSNGKSCHILLATAHHV